MKKTVLIFALTVLMVFSAFAASAASYYPVEDTAGNYSYTVRCDVSALADDATAVVNGESMYGLVAVIGTGDQITLASADSYVYIDQATIDRDGYVTFTGFLPMGPTPDQYLEAGEEAEEGVAYFEECTLFIGGPGFDTAKELGVLKNASAVPVTCKVADSDMRTGGAIITVYDASGAEVIKEETAISSGDIVINVPAGTGYKFEFTKKNYCKFTYTGVDVTGAVELREVDLEGMAGNADGVDGVNAFDLDKVVTNYGATESEYDTTGDGAINAFDLDAVVTNFTHVDVTEAYTAQ